MKIKLILLFSILTLTTCSAQNPMTGTWVVEKVTVGDEVMTPVAKWFSFTDQQTFKSGNGWQQNNIGTYTYSQETNLLTSTNTVGLLDEYGGFTVSFDAQKMFWMRKEDDMEVVVTLSSTKEIPMSTADKITGLWDLKAITIDQKSQIDSLDKNNKVYYYLRPDRLYMKRDSAGERSFGYWHMHGHRPELTLIPMDESIARERWKVSFKEDLLTLSGVSENVKNHIVVYQSLNVFPK